jgi:NADH:ubiquinone oxidoreductase subunit 4 (subunit M)
VLSPTFAAEMLIITGVFNKPIISYFNSNHNVLTAAYALLLFCRVFLVNLKQFILANLLISPRIYVFNTVLVLSIVLGIWPSLVLDTSHVSKAYFAKLCLSTA